MTGATRWALKPPARTGAPPQPAKVRAPPLYQLLNSHATPFGVEPDPNLCARGPGYFLISIVSRRHQPPPTLVTRKGGRIATQSLCGR